MDHSPHRPFRPSWLAVLLVTLTLTLAAGPAHGQPLLFVANRSNNTVGEYNATTGATINAAFVNGQGLSTPVALTMDGNNHLFVANFSSNTVGEYDATTGATINAAFISGQGLNAPIALALDGNNHLFALNNGNN